MVATVVMIFPKNQLITNIMVTEWHRQVAEWQL